MNNNKIEKYIASLRNPKKLTQQHLDNYLLSENKELIIVSNDNA